MVAVPPAENALASDTSMAGSLPPFRSLLLIVTLSERRPLITVTPVPSSHYLPKPTSFFPIALDSTLHVLVSVFLLQQWGSTSVFIH